MNILLKASSRTSLPRIDWTKRFFSLSNIARAAEGRFGYPNERYEPTTIAAIDKDDKQLPLITGLYEDGFLIAGKDRLVGAVFSFPRQIICWNVRRAISEEEIRLAKVSFRSIRPNRSHRNHWLCWKSFNLDRVTSIASPLC